MGGSDVDKIKFYIVLYYVLLYLNVFNDVNG